MSGHKIDAFLDYLAGTRRVAGATQKQALNALVFLYDQALKNTPANSAITPNQSAPNDCRLF